MNLEKTEAVRLPKFWDAVESANLWIGSSRAYTRDRIPSNFSEFRLRGLRFDRAREYESTLFLALFVRWRGDAHYTVLVTIQAVGHVFNLTIVIFHSNRKRFVCSMTFDAKR